MRSEKEIREKIAETYDRLCMGKICLICQHHTTSCSCEKALKWVLEDSEA